MRDPMNWLLYGVVVIDLVVLGAVVATRLAQGKNPLDWIRQHIISIIAVLIQLSRLLPPKP